MDTHGRDDSPERALGALIDAHTHLDFEAFDGTRGDVLARARAAGVLRFVVAGYAPTSFARAEALADADVRVAVGLHPWALAGLNTHDVDRAVEIVAERAARACAVGEYGLDRATAERGGAPLELQRYAAERMLRLADARGAASILHVVSAHADAFALLDAVAPSAPFVVHGFGGSASEAREYVRRGGYVSFGPGVLDPRRARPPAALAEVPLSRLLVESDADGREGAHEPAVLPAVVARIARLLGVDEAVVAAATTANATTLFWPREAPNRVSA